MSSSSGHQYNQYFVPGFGISRHIIFGHIQYYLGPSASVRPYSYQVRRSTRLALGAALLTFTQGREGYLVTAPGQPLTKVSTFAASDAAEQPRALGSPTSDNPLPEPDRRSAEPIEAI